MSKPLALDLTTRPAYSADAEQVIVGSCIAAPPLITQVADILKPGDYYEPRHETIYNICWDLLTAGKPVEPASVIRELEKAGELEKVGGREYIVRLYRQASPTSATYYANEIREDAMRRTAQTINQRVHGSLGMGTGVDTKTAIRDQIAELQALLDTVEDRKGVTFSQALNSLAERAVTSQVTLTPTGILDLDKRLNGGLKPGQVCLVGALTGVGKTHLGIHMTVAAAITAKQPRPVAFFSFEMEAEEVAGRLAANVKIPGRRRIESNLIATRDMSEYDWDTYTEIEQMVKDAPLYIFDKPRQTVSQIRAEAERVKKKHGDLGLIVLDYIQMMGLEKETKDRRVDLENMSRAVKELAKDLKVPIVAMAQLNKESTRRADGRPTEHDIREAHGFAQDADVIILIDRPEKRDPNTDRIGEADLILPKVRGAADGAGMVVTTAFAPQHSLFEATTTAYEPVQGGWNPLAEEPTRSRIDYATGERTPA